MTHTQKRPALLAGGDRAGKILSAENIPSYKAPALAIQVLYVSRKFGLSPLRAGLVAELAFRTGGKTP
jgi:hypothetical protein